MPQPKPDLDPRTLPGWETKRAFASELKIVSEEEGILEAYVAGIGNEDDGGDTIMPGAFSKSLKLRKPKGVWAHDWGKWIAKTIEVEEVKAGDARLPKKMKSAGAGGMRVVAQFNLSSDVGRQAWEDVKFFSDECEFSIGYTTRKSKPTDGGGRTLVDIDWYEWSPVLFGMNALTAAVGIKSRTAALAQEWGVDEAEFVAKIKELVTALDECDDQEDDVKIENNKANAASGPKIAVEPATKVYVEVSGSIEERLRKIGSAFNSWGIDRYGTAWGQAVWGYTEATFDATVLGVVYDRDERKYLQFPYTLGDDGAVLGEPTEVRFDVTISQKTRDAARKLGVWVLGGEMKDAPIEEPEAEVAVKSDGAPVSDDFLREIATLELELEADVA